MYNPYNYSPGINNIGINPYMTTQPLQNNNMQPAVASQSNELIRVTGVDGAKAYQMPPNSITALFDSSEDIFYVKSTDGAGFPTIKAYQFTEIQEQAKQNVQMTDYISREEFEQFKQEVMNNGKQSVSTAKSAKSNDSK